MNDEKKLAPDTPADTLHAHVEHHMSLPAEAKFDNEPLMDEVTSHPNLQSHSIEKMYHHMMTPVTPNSDAQGTTEGYSREWAENLLNHPNAPATIKSDFFARTFHPENSLSDLHQEIADSGQIPEMALRNATESSLASDSDSRPHAYKHLPPEYFMSKFRARSQQDPEGLDDAQQAMHEKELKLGLEGLLNSSRHTPKSLDEAVDAIANSKAMHYGSPRNISDLADLVEKRDDLSKDQINRIHEHAVSSKNDYKDDLIEKVLSHRNADPSLLAKYALGKDIKDQALEHPNLPRESIKGFIKRVKNPNDWSTDRSVRALLSNPSITKEDVNALIAKGSNFALKHKLADEKFVRDAWHKSPKSAEAARNILDAQNTPPDVLKELVNHKNQDVAVQAIRHPRADMDVVQEGLKRKAKTVSDEARVHPLVAGQQVQEGLESGKVSLSKVYTDEDYREHFAKMPPHARDAVFASANTKYAGEDLGKMSKDLKERPEIVLHSKFKLASDPSVPQPIREKQASDLVNMFRDQVVKNVRHVDVGQHMLSSDERHTNSSRIIQAVSQLAEDGDKGAQEAILDNPGMVSTLHDHVNLDNVSPGFLESAYNKYKQYARSGEQVYDSMGRPASVGDHHGVIKNVFRSPNVPDRVFDDIAQDPKLMNQVGEGDDFAKRYNDLPEQEQIAKYAPILAGGSPEALKSILKARAPQSIWNQAWARLPNDEDRGRFVVENVKHVKEHAPHVFSQAVLGQLETNQGRTRYSGGYTAQTKAVKALSPGLEADRNLLKQLISIPSGSPGRMSDENLMESIPDAMFKKDFEMSDAAAASGRPELAYKLAASNFEERSHHLGDTSLLDDLHDTSSSDLPAKAQSLLQGISDRIASMPEPDESDNPVAMKWLSMVKADPGSLFHRVKQAGGNLDFLTEMPGAAGEHLKRVVLSENLASEQKLQSLAQSGNMDDILSVQDSRARGQMLNDFLSRPAVNPEDLDKLAKRIDQKIINPYIKSRGRSEHLSPEKFEQVSGTAKRILDAALTHRPDAAYSLVQNMFRLNENVNGLTKGDTDTLAKELFGHASQRPYANPADRSKAMYATYAGLEIRDIATESMRKAAESAATEADDVSTLVDMSKDGKLSDAGQAKLNKFAETPEIMNLNQVTGLSSTLSYRTDTKVAVGMARAFDKKVAEAQATGKKTTNEQVQLMDNLTNSFDSNSDGDHVKAKNDFVINYNRKAALDPALEPSANSNLLKISSQLSSTDPDQALDIITSLPNDATKMKSTTVNMADSLLNHPRFMENATDGWKLKFLTDGAEGLTGQNVSTVVSRVLDQENPYATDRLALMDRLDANDFALPADSVRLARTMLDVNFNKYIKTMGKKNRMEGNTVYAAHARLADLQERVQDPSKVAPGAPYMGAEHRQHVLSNIEALSHVIRDSQYKEDTPNLKEKIEKVSSMIDTIHSNVETMANEMYKQLEQGGQTDAERREMELHGQYILSTASKISDTGLALDRKDALKVLDMVNHSQSLMNAIEDSTPLSPEQLYQPVKNVIQKAENFEAQDWKEVFASTPHAVFHLSSRSTIPSEALASIDYKFYENHGPISKTEDVQSTFMKESQEWFGKMSKDDIKTHGKNLLGMYVRMMNAGKILRHIDYQDAMVEGMKHVGSSMDHQDVKKLLSNTKDHDIRNNIYRSAVENGVGGKETYKSYVKEFSDEMFKNVKDLGRYQDSDVHRKLEPVLKSPHVDSEDAGKIIDMFSDNQQVMQKSMIALMDNKSVPADAISRMATDLLQNHKGGYEQFNQRDSSDLSIKVMQHPNVSEEHLSQLFDLSNEKFPKYFAPQGQFNPALTNPTYGGKLFRQIPIAVPDDVVHADAGKAKRSISLQHKDYKKVQDIMGLIPAEGMSWADFKRKFPEQEKVIPASAKSVFMTGNNKPVMPEQFAEALRSLDDSAKRYHLTYSSWSNKLQRHRRESAPNLVVQVNNSAESEKTLSQDPKCWALYQKILTSANGITGNQIGMHPTTPHLVSWSRVDTDQGGHSWVIEEYQSDVAQKFRKNLRALIKQFPSGTTINGQHVTAEDMQKYAKTIEKHLDDWVEASMEAVIENAKSHGIKKLYMHGAELRGKMSNSDYNREYWDNPNTKPLMVGFKRIYSENPPKYGFKECDYTDYPKYSSETLNDLKKANLSTKCWQLDLADQPKKKGAKPKLK